MKYVIVVIIVIYFNIMKLILNDNKNIFMVSKIQINRNGISVKRTLRRDSYKKRK